MTRLSSGLLISVVLFIILNYVRPYPHLIQLDDGFDRENRLDPKRSDARCRQCNTPEECFQEPAGGCRWGTFLDRCNHVNCFRGPHEYCEPNSALNRCESRLICKCNKCKGCLKDSEQIYKCFYGDNKPCLYDLQSSNPKF